LTSCWLLPQKEQYKTLSDVLVVVSLKIDSNDN